MRKWLANIRAAENKSQQEVANAAGISQSYYAGIESGVRGKPLAVPVAKKIAAVLGFDWTRFYDENDGEQAIAAVASFIVWRNGGAPGGDDPQGKEGDK